MFNSRLFVVLELTDITLHKVMKKHALHCGGSCSPVQLTLHCFLMETLGFCWFDFDNVLLLGIGIII